MVSFLSRRTFWSVVNTASLLTVTPRRHQKIFSQISQIFSNNFWTYINVCVSVKLVWASDQICSVYCPDKMSGQLVQIISDVLYSKFATQNRIISVLRVHTGRTTSWWWGKLKGLPLTHTQTTHTCTHTHATHNTHTHTHTHTTYTHTHAHYISTVEQNKQSPCLE